MSAVSVQVTETLNSAATLIYTPVGHDARVTVQNLGANPIFIGGSGVTEATGYKILAAASFTLEEGTSAPLYAIANTGDQTSPADTRVLVEPLN